MPTIKPDSPQNKRADLYQTFVLLCETRALRWQFGQFDDVRNPMAAAVDPLLAWAVARELVAAIGMDGVQAVMAKAFREVTDGCHER